MSGFEGYGSQGRFWRPDLKWSGFAQKVGI
jgi:hypothetical protein